MDVGPTFTIGEIVPTLAALIGVGISWGSLSSKIDNEKERHNEVIKRVEQKIEVLERDQVGIIKDFQDIRSKIDAIHERIVSLKICRPDCFFRSEYERNRNSHED